MDFPEIWAVGLEDMDVRGNIRFSEEFRHKIVMIGLNILLGFASDFSNSPRRLHHI